MNLNIIRKKVYEWNVSKLCYRISSRSNNCVVCTLHSYDIFFFEVQLHAPATTKHHSVDYFRKRLGCYCSSFAIKSVNPVNARLVVFPLMRMTSGWKVRRGCRGAKTHQQSIPSIRPATIVAVLPTSVFFKTFLRFILYKTYTHTHPRACTHTHAHIRTHMNTM